MARQRMVKPEFFDSESLGSCSIESRLAFIGLLINSDDYGNQKLQVSRLRLKIFPYDNITDDDFVVYLRELEQVGTIKCFVVDDDAFINIPNFTSYQSIRKPSSTTNPEPPSTIIRAKRTELLSDCSTSASLVRHQYATSTPKERKKERSNGLPYGNPITKEEERTSAVSFSPSDETRAALKCPKCGEFLSFTACHKPNGTKMLRCESCGEEVWV